MQAGNDLNYVWLYTNRLITSVQLIDVDGVQDDRTIKLDLMWRAYTR